MQEIIIDTAIKSFTSKLLKESFSIFGSIADEIAQLYKNEISKYFVKQKNKYSRVKTLLRGNTPAYLYDIYFPINVLKKHEEVNTNKVENLFTDTNFITIIGSAGSGKSILIRHLFLSSISEQYAIPILIELRYLNDYSGTIENYILEVIFENKLSQNRNILDRLLEKGRFIFFLDGFDEISGEKHELTIKQIGSFINKYDRNKYVLTSRPYTNIEFMPLFHNCHMQSLKKDEVNKFIEIQPGNESELVRKIIKSIENNPNKYLSSFLSNPLLLSLYILTFQSNPDIPEKKYIFYRRVVQALFSEHDSKSKIGFVREKSSNLPQEVFEDILKKFSFLSYFDRKYSFELDYILETLNKIKQNSHYRDLDSHLFTKDLKLAIALWIEDGNKIKFSHKSLQEYFASSFVRELNVDQKRTIYTKLIESLSLLNEVDNFLSLCKEMDEVSYSRYFLIPSIESAISNLTCSQDEELIAKVVTQIYSSIGWAESGIPYHYFHSYPMRKIEEIYMYLKPLYNFLGEKMDAIASTNLVDVEGWIENYDYIYGPAEERVWYLNLDPVPQEITTYLIKENILDLIDKIRNDLLLFKHKKELFVIESEKANDSLIEMI